MKEGKGGSDVDRFLQGVLKSGKHKTRRHGVPFIHTAGPVED